MSYERIILQRVKQLRCILPHTGVRKLKIMLADPGYGLPINVGRDMLLKLLGENKMLVKPPKYFHQTTYSKHNLPSYPNLLKGKRITAVNQVWVSDITYLQLPDRKYHYLFLVTDYASRKIIGYALKNSLASEGAIEALQMACDLSNPDDGFIHHSDHGVQYCSKNYLELLRKNNAQISMTGPNHCYDNAVAERVNGILKQEFGLGDIIPNLTAATKLTHQAITLYNNVRLHTSLGFKTPTLMYRSLMGDTDAAPDYQQKTLYLKNEIRRHFV